MVWTLSNTILNNPWVKLKKKQPHRILENIELNNEDPTCQHGEMQLKPEIDTLKAWWGDGRSPSHYSQDHPDPSFPQGASGPEGSPWEGPGGCDPAAQTPPSQYYHLVNPLPRCQQHWGAGDIQEGIGCVHLKGAGCGKMDQSLWALTL